MPLSARVNAHVANQTPLCLSAYARLPLGSAPPLVVAVAGSFSERLPYVTTNLLTSRNNKMPFTLLGSNVNRCVLFKQNSATNFKSGVVTDGSSANALIVF